MKDRRHSPGQIIRPFVVTHKQRRQAKESP